MSRIDWPAKLAVACQPHQPGEAIGQLGVDYLRRDDTLVWRRFSRASVIHRPLLLLPGLSAWPSATSSKIIPRGQRRPLRPELPAVLGRYVTAQATEGVVGRTGGQLWGTVAVLRCCTRAL